MTAGNWRKTKDKNHTQQSQGRKKSPPPVLSSTGMRNNIGSSCCFVGADSVIDHDQLFFFSRQTSWGYALLFYCRRACLRAPRYSDYIKRSLFLRTCDLAFRMIPSPQTIIRLESRNSCLCISSLTRLLKVWRTIVPQWCATTPLV